MTWNFYAYGKTVHAFTLMENPLWNGNKSQVSHQARVHSMDMVPSLLPSPRAQQSCLNAISVSQPMASWEGNNVIRKRKAVLPRWSEAQWHCRSYRAKCQRYLTM